MKFLQRQDDYSQFRKEYPEFIYEGFKYGIHKDKIRISYVFRIGDEIVFKPETSIGIIDDMDLSVVDTDLFRNLVFNAGMIELISYWKATASPMVRINPGSPGKEALEWWKNLYYKGLGEYFYVNGITANKQDFLNIVTAAENTKINPHHLNSVENKCIVPVGGGKDSIVSIEVIKQWPHKIYPMSINPTPATWRTIETAGYNRSECIIFKRSIDPLLLKLNSEGFLNGHTPFSAVIAFYSLMAAALTNSRYVALSNESSASEATIPGTEINHQYSKSIDFEKNFRHYTHNYIEENINYFSLLRPVNEYQIAAMFSGFKGYHKVFRSCNTGSKNEIWCGSCPKCLFTYIILHPFLGDPGLVKIFGKDLFRDGELWPVLQELAGIAKHKPFECVGTVDEVRYALSKSLSNFGMDNLPVLLEKINLSEQSLSVDSLNINHKKLNPDHFVPDNFLRLLNNTLWDAKWPNKE